MRYIMCWAHGTHSQQMTQVISNGKLPFMQIHFRFSLYFRASLVWFGDGIKYIMLIVSIKPTFITMCRNWLCCSESRKPRAKSPGTRHWPFSVALFIRINLLVYEFFTQMLATKYQIVCDDKMSFAMRWHDISQTCTKWNQAANI